jgi:arylsulfatase A-like enzyme
MERHDAKHALFGGTNVGSFSEYFRTRANDYEQIREEYKADVEIACDRFQSIRDTLAEHSQLENTLAVFTSDHGEQLGEADDVAHS